MIMPRSVYKRNGKGMRDLMTSTEMEEMVVSAALKGQVYAESIAPRDTEAYVTSFAVESTRHGGPKQDRAEARLVNNDYKAALVEYVNENGGVLGRTVDFIEDHGP